MIDGTPFSDFGARAEVTALLANTNPRVAKAPLAQADCSESPARHDFSRLNDSGADADNAHGSSSTLNGAEASTAPGISLATEADWREAEAKAQLARQFSALLERGFSGNQAASQLDRPHSLFSGERGIVALYQRGGVAALLPKRRECGAKPTVLPEVPAWFIAAARYFYLLSNRSWNRGSTPEALRRTISLPNVPHGWTHKERLKFINFLKSEAGWHKDTLPECPEVIRETILTRAKLGQAMLPDRLLRQITVGELAIRSHRSPRNAWLDYVQSPGSLMLTVDELTGFERYIKPGEVMTIDDATKNFPCVVPGLQKPGDKCFDRWGVMVARFQFIVVVDHVTGFITGWNHTARPRSSYRAEDLTATMQVTFAQHGAPKVMVMEKGVSAANLVKETLSQLGVQILRASSPHQKVVENVFNKLWTKLAVQFPGSDVGRFQGENEEASRLLEACRSGAHDPRKFFPTLDVVVTVLRDVIAEHNATTVNSRYGRWIPEDRFAAESAEQLTALEPANVWMFSPNVTQPLVLKNSLIKTTVQFLPGYSQKFAFNVMPFASEFFGASVKLFFNAFAADCTAKVVLAEAFNGQPKGAVLGDAEQFDREAKYSRRWLQYSLEEDNGRDVVRANAQAVHRFSQAVRPGRAEGKSITEARDGLGAVASIEISAAERAEHKARTNGAQRKSATAPQEAHETKEPLSSARPPAEKTLAEKIAETNRFEAENAHLFV